MKVIDLLDEQKHSKLLSDYKNGSKYHDKPKTSHKANKERLSTRDVEDLMGVKRNTYEKVSGRVKQR